MLNFSNFTRDLKEMFLRYVGTITKSTERTRKNRQICSRDISNKNRASDSNATYKNTTTSKAKNKKKDSCPNATFLK